jgi:hypothetical protein
MFPWQVEKPELLSKASFPFFAAIHIQTAAHTLRGVKWFKGVMVGEQSVIELDPAHGEIRSREKFQPTGDR